LIEYIGPLFILVAKNFIIKEFPLSKHVPFTLPKMFPTHYRKYINTRDRTGRLVNDIKGYQKPEPSLDLKSDPKKILKISPEICFQPRLSLVQFLFLDLNIERKKFFIDNG